MRKTVLMTLTFGLLLANSSFAAVSSKSTTTLKTTTKADPQIKDNEIRSEMGSMSKFSLSANIYYGGGALDDPFGASKPNPQNYDSSGKTSMSGTFSLRYRINKMSSLKLSTGLYLQTPFAEPQNFDLSSPSLSYSFTNKMDGLVGRGYLSAKYYTDEYSHDKSNKRFKFTTGYKFKVYNVMIPSLYLGLGFNGGFYTYGHNYIPGVDSYNSTLYYFNVTPEIGYRINSKYNIKTSLNFGRSNYRRYESKTKFENNVVEQNIGLGVGFTKEVYLYSYILTYPQNYRLDTATFGMSLNFSLF